MDPNAPRIPGYEILGVIGAGSMGVVYRARKAGRKGFVALKVIAPGLAARRSFAARLRREARAACVVRHPNVVEGIDVGESDGLAYFAMEHVEGKTLAEVLRERGPLPEAEALGIVRQAAEGLRAAHRAGVLHRDIKPSNLLLARDGQVKIADLGLAKEVDPGAVAEREDGDPGTDAGEGIAARLQGISLEGTITRTGVILGTPHYASPEQIRGGRDLDIRTDIYSLGATLYQALTGRKPFGGTTVAEVVSHALAGDVPGVREARPDVSRATGALVRRMMAPRRQDRFRDPDELLAAIRAAERFLARGAADGAEEPAAAAEASLEALPEEPAAEGRARRIPALLGAAAAVVLLAVAAAIASRLGGGAPGERPAEIEPPRRPRPRAAAPPIPPRAFPPPLEIEAEDMAEMIPRTLPARPPDGSDPRPLEVGWRFRKAGEGVRAGFSGRGYVVAAPRAVQIYHEDYAGKMPEARYPVDLPAGGTWRVWVRIASDGDQNDTLHLGFDGKPHPAGQAVIDPRKDGRWGWTNARKDTDDPVAFELPAGRHVLHLWMREGGVRVDRFLLTRDPAFRP